MALPEVPDIAFATDDLYVGGQSNGLPTKVQPSSGVVAQGFAPGEFLPFPRLNYKLHELAKAGWNGLDASAFEWRPLAAYAHSLYIDSIANQPVIIATRTWIVSDRDLNHHGSFSFRYPQQGMNIAGNDTAALFSNSTVGTSLPDSEHTMHYGGEEVPQDVLFQATGDGVTKKYTFSDDTFSTAAAGTALFLTSGTPTSVSCGTRLNGVWYLHTQTLTSTRFQFSSTLSGTWTVGSSLLRSENPGAIRRIARKSDRYVLFSANATTVALNIIGTGFVERSLGGSALSWSGAYNPTIDKFMAVGTDGAFASRICVADGDGLTWTAITFGGAVAPYGHTDIVAHGRGFVIAAGNALYFVVQNAEDAWTGRRIPIDTPSNALTSWYLQSQGGRAIAARVIHPTALDRRLELWSSGISPLGIEL